MKLLYNGLGPVLLLAAGLVGFTDAMPYMMPGPQPQVPQLNTTANKLQIASLKQNLPTFDELAKPLVNLEEGIKRLLKVDYTAKVKNTDCYDIDQVRPQTRYYDWTVHYASAAPDGFARRQIMINGQSPGPTIEINEGDTVVVRVKNNLDSGTSMHWHGMIQNSTMFMDGISGFTQCNIPPGGSFEYRFKVEGQHGTYWYHSHNMLQYTEGQYGAFIVHSRNDPYRQGRDYDEELVFLLADNYHDEANSIAKQMLSPAGYKGSPAAPSPQSGLINGRGVYNCSLANRTDSCMQLRTPTKTVVPGRTYRLRIINAGSHAFNYVSIDGHELDVIAADGTPIKRQRVHRIPLHNGQRYDALVTMNKGKAGDSFLFRSFIQTACFAVIDSTLDPTANLTLQYKSSPMDVSRSPIPNDWARLQSEQKCVDFRDDMLVPLIREDVPVNRDARAVAKFVTGFGFMNVTNNQQVGRFFVNGTTYTDFVNRPLLDIVHNGGTIDPKRITSFTFSDNTWWGDIILQNTDQIDHPMHLHGNPMHIVGRGSGNLTIAQWENMSFHTNNPPRRDTIVVPAKSYLVARVKLDDPGVWALHCHIAFHLAGGFMGAVVVHPQRVQQIPFPASVQALCPSDLASLNSIEIP